MEVYSLAFTHRTRECVPNSFSLNPLPQTETFLTPTISKSYSRSLIGD